MMPDEDVKESTNYMIVIGALLVSMFALAFIMIRRMQKKKVMPFQQVEMSNSRSIYSIE